MNTKREKTKFTGVFYRNSITNEKEDKTYYIVYKDPSGKVKEIKVGKYSEGIRENYCNQKRIEIINKLRLGELPPLLIKKNKKDRITFDDLASIYFKDKEIHNRSNTKTKSRYESQIQSMIGGLDIDTIEKLDIEKIQQKLAIVKSAKTVNFYLQFIKTVFNHAIKNGHFKHINPCNGIVEQKIDNKRERYLTIEEIKDLLNEVSSDNELFLFVKLSLATGGRLKTILEIRKKDIDFENGNMILKDMKNNSTYRGFISKDIKALLKDAVHLKKADDKIIAYSMRTIQRNLSDILNRLFNKDLRKNDRKNRAVIHTLRHTFASHLAIQGTPIFTIQKLMNHKDIAQTMRYAKLAPDSGKNMVEHFLNNF